MAAFRAVTADGETPLAIASRVARVKAVGLRILVDDTTLGPYETGAQVTTLAIVDTLAQVIPMSRRWELHSGTMFPRTRRRARAPQAHAGDPLRTRLRRRSRTTTCCIAPPNPTTTSRSSAARVAARRVVVSILDLIAYRAGSYHATGDDWLEYREALRAAIAAADGVTTISEDVADMLRLEGLPASVIGSCRSCTAPSTSRARKPRPYRASSPPRDRIAGEFVLCLGTDYAHKNRDLAIAVHRLLRSRGHDVTLVLAGPSVPFGCTRDVERQMLRTDDGVIVLPNVASAERNWLLRHAVAVLYPTSAEGFGLVPFEAARFGTPTVSVGFGPLLETTSGVPVSVGSWSVEEFANAVDALVRDPGLRRSQVDATLSDGCSV